MATVPREGVSESVCGPVPCHFLATFCNVLSLIEYERRVQELIVSLDIVHWTIAFVWQMGLTR